MVAVERIRLVGGGTGTAPDADMVPDDTVVPAEDTVVPAEDTVVSAEDMALEVAHNIRAGLEGLSIKHPF